MIEDVDIKFDFVWTGLFQSWFFIEGVVSLMSIFNKIKQTKSSAYFNSEAYADPTAYHGLKNVIKEEAETERKVNELVHVIKVICSFAGFDLVERVKLKHKKSGRKFE